MTALSVVGEGVAMGEQGRRIGEEGRKDIGCPVLPQWDMRDRSHLDVVDESYIARRREESLAGPIDAFFFQRDDRAGADRAAAAQAAPERQESLMAQAGEDIQRLWWKAVAMLVAIVLVGFAGMIVGRAFAPSYDGKVQHYIVQPHDTLWSIAKRTGSSLPTEDVVSRIMDLNDLETSTIVANQHLVIPQQ